MLLDEMAIGRLDVAPVEPGQRGFNLLLGSLCEKNIILSAEFFEFICEAKRSLSAIFNRNLPLLPPKWTPGFTLTGLVSLHCHYLCS
jgi:hypothetical protein